VEVGLLLFTEEQYEDFVKQHMRKKAMAKKIKLMLLLKCLKMIERQMNDRQQQPSQNSISRIVRNDKMMMALLL